MPRAGLSREALVELALAELDATGGAPLSIGAIAARAGVRPPSIYKHVDGLAELEALTAARTYDDLADALATATADHGADDAARAFLHAYRAFAVRYPARYRALPVQPSGHPALEAAAARVLDLAGRAVAGLSGDDAIHALRGLRAAAHGFATLEAAGGFGLGTDVDASFDRLVERLVG
ncbi:TetR/AcrR family transcriptional regulator [Agrococcus sp. HG114]|uniref:TetR/AcrR family transcriptional regulator n=1 Tax=Agrococcus sp. HG114 TaxID=2969757 RepID=UPI00215B2BC0|nr:TetR-like C-terminal domain-containing protein [Agrococcus sp. HG114]MCR8669980.1 WHG domain-containing protein [Agrococcus sp. HG114]